MIRRRILINNSQDEELYVDLELPSGILWAKGNLVKDSNSNYSIGKETNYGTYVSWGNIVGHNEDEGYNFNQTSYNSTPGNSVSVDIPSNDTTCDIALATLGFSWHLPTKEDFKELYDNTDSEWVADYNGTGVAGRKFMKKSDHSVYVFFPASGYYSGTSLSYRGTYGYYWSSSSYSATIAYHLYFTGPSVNPRNSYYRRFGFTVRPVRYNFSFLQEGFTMSGVAGDDMDMKIITHFDNNNRLVCELYVDPECLKQGAVFNIFISALDNGNIPSETDPVVLSQELADAFGIDYYDLIEDMQFDKASMCVSTLLPRDIEQGDKLVLYWHGKYIEIVFYEKLV